MILQTQWLLNSRKTFPGKNCLHPTLPQLVLRQEIKHQTVQPEGAEVPPEHGRVSWGGNRLDLTPGALPAETGHRHSWCGGHLVTTINHEVSQVSAEKFKGEQFYNLEQTANTLNDTNIKMLQVADRIYSQRIQQGSPEHSPLLMHHHRCIRSAP